MDFLDPKAKRRHKIRLIIGYALMGTLIVTTSAILVFSAYGFDVDRKTGEVIQNGMVFVDSAPDGAQVVFNDQLQKDKTNNRFSLPSSSYNLKIQKEGYRDWHRGFQLGGGEVKRFTYPLLIPHKLEPREIQSYDALPTFVSESPDRRWVIANQANSLTNFTEYDLNNLVAPNDDPRTRTFVLPAGVFSASAEPGKIELVEWSTDNKHFLVKHTFGTSTEFVMVSRDQPQTSFNINKLLGQNPTKVALRDKKFDQWYIFTQEGGVLQAADAKKVITPVAKGVTSYKTHDSDTILYATQAAEPGAKTQRVILKQGNNSYTVKDVAIGPIMLDIAQYDSKWRVVIGAEAEQKTYVFTDPVPILQKDAKVSLVPSAVLKSNGPLSWVGFSQNTRFIVAQSGQHFEVYDAEYEEDYRYDIDSAFDPDTKAEWIDGHRITARSQGKAIIFDFDGSNKQELVVINPTTPLMFDRDYTVMYSVNNSKATEGKFGLFGTELRLDGDK